MLSGVKRFAVTLLIVLYSFVLAWSTVERTASWAAKQSEAMARPDTGDSVNVGKGHAAEKKHDSNRRIIENPYVVEPPALVSSIDLTPQRLHRSTELLPSNQGVRKFSGRAPPLSL
jgi:hypothetical protein